MERNRSNSCPESGSSDFNPPSFSSSPDSEVSTPESETLYYYGEDEDYGKPLRPAPGSPTWPSDKIGLKIRGKKSKWGEVDWDQTESKFPRERSISPCDKSLNTWAEGEEPPMVWTDREPVEEVWEESESEDEDGEGVGKVEKGVKAEVKAEDSMTEHDRLMLQTLMKSIAKSASQNQSKLSKSVKVHENQPSPSAETNFAATEDEAESQWKATSESPSRQYEGFMGGWGVKLQGVMRWTLRAVALVFTPMWWRLGWRWVSSRFGRTFGTGS